MAANKKKLSFYIGAAALLFLFVRATRAPKTNYSPMPITDENIKEALRKIFNEFGREKTEKLEQLYRKETSHFRSGQFKGGASPGMEPSPNTNRTFPYGWKSLEKFSKIYNIPASAFYITGPYTEGGTGKQKFFIGFPNVYTAMLFVMYVISLRGWNFGKWRAFDENISTNYNNSLNTIIPKITRTF
jgi:hypothetical protein